MQEHGAAAAGDAWCAVVVDLDDKVIEIIGAGKPVAGLVVDQPNGLIVVTVLRVFAPGIFRPDRADGQEGSRPRMAVGAPP